MLSVEAAGSGGLQVDLSGQGLSGAWVTITVSDDPGLPRDARLLVSLAAGDDRTGPLLDEENLGGGVFAWTGRLPDGIAGLRVGCPSTDRPLAVRHVALRRHGRLAAVARALARDPATAARAIYWRVLGKKVRGRAILEHALRERRRAGYAAWIRRHATPSDDDRGRIRAEVATWTDPPLISVLMPVFDPAPPILEAAIRSVEAQLYPFWELCIADDASTDPAIPRLLARSAAADSRIRVMRRGENGHIARASNDALALARGSYVAFLDHDDLLHEQALYEVARAVRSDLRLVLVYTDEDAIDRRGRRVGPHFKSDFDRELLYAQNYINHLTAIRTDRVRALGGFRPGLEGSQDHDLLLRLTADLDPARIRHIPQVLYHWRTGRGSGTFSDRAAAQAEAARLRALAEIVEPRGGRAVPGPLGYARYVRARPDPPPLVSVIIPTRDRAELLAVALDGLLAGTDYAPLEVVVLDNGSREAETSALFASYRDDPRLRVVPAPGPFNFSELCNRGAAEAAGSLLLFLNNDVETIETGWLAEMVSIAVEPDIGAVGAKLLFLDGTLQHGGIVLGVGGVAAHSHFGQPGGGPGYFARTVLPHEVSAVTGACLLMRADLFREVGGFDALDLEVAFNDVDLCLRVRKAGYRIVWTPYATLVHHESASRGPEDTPEKRARFQAEAAIMRARWGVELRADPYYNPNLSRLRPDYVV